MRKMLRTPANTIKYHSGMMAPIFCPCSFLHILFLNNIVSNLRRSFRHNTSSMKKNLTMLIVSLALILATQPALSFAPFAAVKVHATKRLLHISPTTTHLRAINNSGLSESDQGVVGAVGSVMAITVFYSEFTLFSTGCGLPAGPFGLLGLAEGLSYLGIIGIGGYSLNVKVKTVSELRSSVDSNMNFQ